MATTVVGVPSRQPTNLNSLLAQAYVIRSSEICVVTTVCRQSVRQRPFLPVAGTHSRIRASNLCLNL
jgi:hypothetical protein